MRISGLYVYRVFAEAVMLEEGAVRRLTLQLQALAPI